MNEDDDKIAIKFKAAHLIGNDVRFPQLKNKEGKDAVVGPPSLRWPNATIPYVIAADYSKNSFFLTICIYILNLRMLIIVQ